MKDTINTIGHKKIRSFKKHTSVRSKCLECNGYRLTIDGLCVGCTAIKDIVTEMDKP